MRSAIIAALTALFALTLAFNLRQEFLGPAASGWRPVWPTLEVAAVVRGTPAERAGMRAGDVLEVADGRPLHEITDWLVARAHFERGKPVEVQVRRGTQHLRMQYVITQPSFREWRLDNLLAVSGFYLARTVLLLLAIFLAWRRPRQPSALLVALMFAITSVAEGFPSSGWAASLHHLPLAIAVPICLATSVWLLGAVVWLAFFEIYPPPPPITRAWQWELLLAPLLLLVPPMVTSAVAMIDHPSALRPPSVPIAEDLAGVAPLLYFDGERRVVAWLVITVLYLIAGFVLLALRARRRADRVLSLSIVLFALIAIHNLLVRNWTNWFHTTAPALVSHGSYAGEALVFLTVPFALTYAVLTAPVFRDS